MKKIKQIINEQLPKGLSYTRLYDIAFNAAFGGKDDREVVSKIKANLVAIGIMPEEVSEKIMSYFVTKARAAKAGVELCDDFADVGPE